MTQRNKVYCLNRAIICLSDPRERTKGYTEEAFSIADICRQHTAESELLQRLVNYGCADVSAFTAYELASLQQRLIDTSPELAEALETDTTISWIKLRRPVVHMTRKSSPPYCNLRYSDEERSVVYAQHTGHFAKLHISALWTKSTAIWSISGMLEYGIDFPNREQRLLAGTINEKLCRAFGLHWLPLRITPDAIQPIGWMKEYKHKEVAK